MEYIIIAIAMICLCLLINAALVWLVCWGLVKIGITAICGWSVGFSWPLVIVITAITAIINMIRG